MTVGESLKSWLMDFNTDARRLKAVNTDLLSAKVEEFAIVKEPTVNRKPNVFGDEEVTAHYTLLARLPNDTELDRVDNNSFGESIEAWIEEKNSNKEYPEISGYTVTNVAVTTVFYAYETNEHNSVYQMTIALKYEK